jgi:hypothetical protein
MPEIKNPDFLREAAEMNPIAMSRGDSKQYVLGKKGVGYILFSATSIVYVDLRDDRTVYNLSWINPSTGAVVQSKIKVKGGVSTVLKAPLEGNLVAWLSVK